MIELLTEFLNLILETPPYCYIYAVAVGGTGVGFIVYGVYDIRKGYLADKKEREGLGGKG
jgi:hypothetical protein